MKIDTCGLMVWTALCLPVVYVSAKDLPGEQKEVQRVIKEIYSVAPDTFEHGEFDGEGKPVFLDRGGLNKKTKYQPERTCNFLRAFFTEAMLQVRPIKAGGGVKCSPQGNFARFPNLGSEDLTGRSSADLPKPKVARATVSGETGRVEVLINRARVIYFLTRTGEGWRVSNALIHEKWPDLEVDKCNGGFVLRPNPVEVTELVPQCR